MKKIPFTILFFLIYIICFSQSFNTHSINKSNLHNSNSTINILDFGAIPNDNKNDATAIDSATIFAQQYGYSTILFPPGIYHSSAINLNMGSNLNYIGYGATIVQTIPNTSLFYTENVQNVLFEGLSFVGYGKDYTGADTYAPRRPGAIYIAAKEGQKSNNVRIINCAFKNFAHSAIFCHSTNNIWIENNKITGIRQLIQDDNHCFGINLSSKNTKATIIGNQIDSTAQGIVCQNDVDEVQIIGNKICNITGQHGIYLSSARNTIVANNIIKNCANNGILVQLTASNFFGMDNVNISNNIVDSAKNYGIYIYRITGNLPLRNFCVVNNIINGDTTNVGVGLEISHVNGAIVSGNIVRGYKYGLYMRGNKNIHVSNHTSYNSSECGILIAADSTKNLIFDNVYIYEPSLKNISGNAFGFSISGGSDITLNNVNVRDTLSRSFYSLYIQPGVNQSTIKIRNSTFLNTPIRFENSKLIGEWNNNFATNYYNTPKDVINARTSFLGSTTELKMDNLIAKNSDNNTLNSSSSNFIQAARGTFIAAARGTSLILSDTTNSSFYVTHPSLNRVNFNNSVNNNWLFEIKGNVTLPGKTTSAQYILSDLNVAPKSSTDIGIKGEIRVTGNFIYVCIANNTWARSPLSKW